MLSGIPLLFGSGQRNQSGAVRRRVAGTRVCPYEIVIRGVGRARGKCEVIEDPSGQAITTRHSRPGLGPVGTLEVAPLGIFCFL